MFARLQLFQLAALAPAASVGSCERHGRQLHFEGRHDGLWVSVGSPTHVSGSSPNERSVNTAEALGLAGVVGVVVTHIVRKELRWMARDALRTRSAKRWLLACRVATWDVYAAVVVAAAALLIVSEHWENDPALTAVVVAVTIGIVGGLCVERLTGSGASYWATVEASLEQAVNDPCSRTSQREQFNKQRPRLTSGPTNHREEAVEGFCAREEPARWLRRRPPSSNPRLLLRAAHSLCRFRTGPHTGRSDGNSPATAKAAAALSAVEVMRLDSGSARPREPTRCSFRLLAQVEVALSGALVSTRRSCHRSSAALRAKPGNVVAAHGGRIA